MGFFSNKRVFLGFFKALLHVGAVNVREHAVWVEMYA